MAANLLFYYLGNDEAYYKTLQAEFKRNTRLTIDFKKIYEINESKIQSLFIQVYRAKPACLFIDFSKNTQDYLHLARIFTRTGLDHKMTIVGLVDYLSPPEIMLESISTGINLTHIKSAEIFDVIFDVAKLIAPAEMSEHGFAIASLDETWEAGVNAKAGYVSNTSLHIETDYKLSKGDRVKLNHFWLKNKMIPSKEAFVTETSNSNMYYHFKQNADLEFVFVDEFMPPEGMEPQLVTQKNEERTESILFHKKQMKKWVTENMSASSQKKAKVLIVDHEFHFYQDQPRIDKHPYIIRCVPNLIEIETVLNQLQPQVIAFSMDDSTGGDPTKKNNNDSLVKLVETLKGNFKTLNPFIIIFNCKTPSKEMQQGLKYDHCMTTGAEITVDTLVRMADIFEKKMEKSAVIGVKETNKVFLKKTNPSSHCEILINIKIKKLSETDMILTTDYPFNPGTNLHIISPVNMFINVQPSKNNGEYHGLIHGIGEADKKDLRKFVNTIFFREHDAQVQSETAEFKKLNEAKQLEKLELVKKEQEAQAAQAALADQPPSGTEDEIKKDPEKSSA